MRIAVDAMGGDRAPGAPVEGALRALEAYEDISVVLVGDEAAVRTAHGALRDGAELPPRLSIQHAPVLAGKGEDPVRDVRATPDNSARVCAELLRREEVQGVLTMGATGAAVAAATLFCRRLEGVRRLGIAAPIPRQGGLTILVDAGANPDARAEDLHQYAVMASYYVQHALGVDAPRVGILSIGEEKHKGNRLVAETWELFEASPLQGFVGNVEPREVVEDRVDVLVADGFCGNVMLKAVEGMAEYILRSIPEFLGETPEGRAFVPRLVKQLAERVDYEEYGGAPLLGVRGAYVIGHGRSGPRAFQNGVRVIRSYVVNDVGQRIVDALAPASAGSSEGV